MSAAPQPGPDASPAGLDPAASEEHALLTAAIYASELDAWQHSLVPLAMGLPCWIVAPPLGSESARRFLRLRVTER